MLRHTLLRPIGSLLLLAGITACGSSSSSSGTPPTAPPTTQRIYATSYAGSSPNFTRAIDVFAMPLSASSTPSIHAQVPNPATYDAGNIAVDTTGNLAACSFATNILVYSAPLSSSSTPSATIPTACGGPAFDSSGKLYVPTQGAGGVKVYSPPFTSASTPTLTITTGLSSPSEAAFDSSGNLYVDDDGAVPKIVVFAPPYTGAPSYTITSTSFKALRGISVDSHGNLAVADLGTGGVGMIHVINAPLSASSTVAFDLTANVNTPEQLAFDKSGSLYVANVGSTTGWISVYASPLTAASTPLVLSYQSNFGVALGP